MYHFDSTFWRFLFEEVLPSIGNLQPGWIFGNFGSGPWGAPARFQSSDWNCWDNPEFQSYLHKELLCHKMIAFCIVVPWAQSTCLVLESAVLAPASHHWSFCKEASPGYSLFVWHQMAVAYCRTQLLIPFSGPGRVLFEPFECASIREVTDSKSVSSTSFFT